MITSKVLGKRIRYIRESKKMSQELIEDKLNELGILISRETLSKIETGNRPISAVELKAICLVIDVDIEILLEDNEEDSLVNLFRKRSMSEEAIKRAEILQYIIMSFINQKKIFNTNAIISVESLWKN